VHTLKQYLDLFGHGMRAVLWMYVHSDKCSQQQTLQQRH